MIEPEQPTEQYIRGRISFHQSQAQWFTQQDQTQLAAWANSLVEKWHGKLEAQYPQKKEDGEQ